MAKQIPRSEVASHNTEDSLWMIIDSKVYDLTDFVDAHPGGETVLRQVAGTDATTAFFNLHRYEVLQKYANLCVGTVAGETSAVVDPQPGDLSQVPYGEPAWLTPEFSSPYYTESHRTLQRRMREFVETHVMPEAQEDEREGKHISQALVDRMADLNIHAMRLGPGPHLKGRTLMDGAVKPEEFDYFHELVIAQELARNPMRGFQDGNMAGMVIGLPAVLRFAAPHIRDRVSNEVLSGKRGMCLAITEAFGGSDVAGMQTVAEKSADGKHWIVSGTKKWITNGLWSHYFVTAVRTSKTALSMLLIERQEGLETENIKTSYSGAAATSFVTFDKVKVPVENLLGEEGDGLRVTLANFNHERWMMSCSTIRQLRNVTEECLKWTSQRRAFGKALNEQPVIRQKLAACIAHAEAMQAWLEHITLQMTRMDYATQSRLLAGPIALLKLSATRAAHDVADHAVQIFGGRALTASGMGRNIEMFQRTYKFDAILGGAEEILADLGVRQAMKRMPKAML